MKDSWGCQEGGEEEEEEAPGLVMVVVAAEAAAREDFLCRRSRCPAAIFAALIRFTIVLGRSVARPLVVLISFGVHVPAISRRWSPRRWLG